MPLPAAIAARATTSCSFRARFSPVKRGSRERKSPATRRRAAQQAARQHAVGGHADAELGKAREDLRLGSTTDERILDLQVGDRMHGVRAFDGVDPHLRQTDRADIASVDEVGNGANRVLDRHSRIEPGGPVDVDVIDAQPLQRIAEEVFHGDRPGINTCPAAVGRRRAPNFTDRSARSRRSASARPINISLWPLP